MKVTVEELARRFGPRRPRHGGAATGVSAGPPDPARDPAGVPKAPPVPPPTAVRPAAIAGSGEFDPVAALSLADNAIARLAADGSHPEIQDAAAAAVAALLAGDAIGVRLASQRAVAAAVRLTCGG